MTITFPYPPSVNRYWRTIVKGNRAFPILSSEAREYKARMATYAAVLQPSQEPVSLTIRLYRPRKAGLADRSLSRSGNRERDPREHEEEGQAEVTLTFP